MEERIPSSKSSRRRRLTKNEAIGISPRQTVHQAGENGYIESFNSRMRDELFDGELFLHIYVVERLRADYNHYRPHSNLDYMAPSAFAAKCLEQGSGTFRLAQDKDQTTTPLIKLIHN
jgi:transposase InsO family protein